MENNLEADIGFAIKREMLLTLFRAGQITKEEFDKTIRKLRSKGNCKLIVTSASI